MNETITETLSLNACLEALMFVAPGAVTPAQLAAAMEIPVAEVEKLLDDMNASLRERAWKSFEEMIQEAADVEAIKKKLEKKGGIVRVPWCGQEACGTSLGERTGADILGQELEGKQASGICPICSKKAKVYVLIAKTY